MIHRTQTDPILPPDRRGSLSMPSTAFTDTCLNHSRSFEGWCATDQVYGSATFWFFINEQSNSQAPLTLHIRLMFS